MAEHNTEHNTNTWTFTPPFEDLYRQTEERPRVLLLGVEPNGDVNGPYDRDMGAWMRLAHDNTFYNPGGRRFFRAQLLHIQIARVALGELTPEDVKRGWWEAGEDGEAAQQKAHELMGRCRVADLKSTPGGSVAHYKTINEWVGEHIDEVRALFDPAPDIVIAQGAIVQRILTERGGELFADLPDHVKWLGLPHPSAQQGYPTEALEGAQGQLTNIRSDVDVFNCYRRDGWRDIFKTQDTQEATTTTRLPQAAQGKHVDFYQSLQLLDLARLNAPHQLVDNKPGEAWLSFKIQRSKAACVYLQYNGQTWLNQALGADPSKLPCLQTKDYTYLGPNTGGQGKNFTRHRYQPNFTNPGAAPRWAQLFEEVIARGGVLP